MVFGSRVEHVLHFWSCLDWAKGNFLLDLCKGLLLLRALVESVLFMGDQVGRAYDLTVFGNVHLLKTYGAQESLCFFFAGWWRHGCDLVDDIGGNLTLFILLLHFQKLDLLSRSLDFAFLDGEASFQENLDDFFSFFEHFCCCLLSHNDVINILQMFWSFTFFQGTLDQSMADGGAVLLLLGQLILGVLHVSLGESKLRLAFCCQRNGEKCIGNVYSGVLLCCF